MSNRSKLKKQAVLVAAIAAAFPVIAHSAAGRVEFAVGNVTGTGADGKMRNLTRGAEISEGDRITTALDGRAQIRFTDGAFMSLQPDTDFRVDQYRFEGRADGNEKGFFSLIKGGLRTLTGLVGRSNRGNYRVSTRQPRLRRSSCRRRRHPNSRSLLRRAKIVIAMEALRVSPWRAVCSPECRL